MKKTISSILIAALFTGCASLSNFNSDPIVKQTRDALILNLLTQLPTVAAGNYAKAFGDAIRSLEGTEVALIPAQIQALRAKWLPKGNAYTQFAASLAAIYLSAHPSSNADAQKILEAIAMGLQTQ